MLEKIRVSMLARKLQETYDKMVYHKAEYDMNGFPLPFGETIDKPVLTVLNGNIAWIYRGHGWKVYIALVPYNARTENFLGVPEIYDDVFETEIDDNVFDITGKEPAKPPIFRLQEVRKLILKYKSSYITEVDGWLKRSEKYKSFRERHGNS